MGRPASVNRVPESAQAKRRRLLLPASSATVTAALAPSSMSSVPTPARAADNKAAASSGSMSSPGPCCRQHGQKPMCLKRVRKENANMHRLFFACRATGCKFFEWADLSFPSCQCKPFRKAVLRVSKKEGTAGRWFFGCQAGTRSPSGGDRCGYFAWASQAQLGHVSALLTPLT
eukprot:TRINITY_DN41699_c0_g1_i1.p2 TRINITY_DN41699_c0_g1~~TRINITY_DN41699_c0_g1_i1.p2  ORF type:complete len:174 (-),score=11.31 TRINITY_DN41699_c0_g1_i1:114-635(-)